MSVVDGRMKGMGAEAEAGEASMISPQRTRGVPAGRLARGHRFMARGGQRGRGRSSSTDTAAALRVHPTTTVYAPGCHRRCGSCAGGTGRAGRPPSSSGPQGPS